MFAKVVVDIKSSKLNETFDYIIPKELEDLVFIGSRVLVSFGFNDILGYVVDISEESVFAENIKPIKEVLDYDKEITDEQVELAKHLSYELNAPLASTLDLMMPSFLKSKKRKYLYIENYDKLNPDLALFFRGKRKVYIDNDVLEKYNLIKKEIEQNNITLEYDIYTYGSRKKTKVYSMGKNPHVTTKKRKKVIEYIKENPNVDIDNITLSCKVSKALINQLEKEGNIKSKAVYKITEAAGEPKIKNDWQLNFDQNQLYAKFHETKGKPYLMFSNDEDFKINFYMELILEVLKKEKSIFMLAPSIMMVEEIAEYLKNNVLNIDVLTYHSKNPNSDNYDLFMRLKSNKALVTVSTSMGVFLPFNNLGLAIVFDEDSANYIYDNFPYYDARMVLEKRCENLGAKLIFDSQSPSINSFYKTRAYKYHLLDYQIPISSKVIKVDMREEILESNNLIVSNVLNEQIKIALKENKISMLIVNNKSFSTLVKCRDCGEVKLCPECKVPLTFLKSKNIARCNYCGHQDEKHHICEKCHSKNMVSYGFGLEQVFHKLSMDFPKANILQVDSDEVRTLEDYNKVLLTIEENTADIIVGTNALTKKLNYDNIKVVGFLYIDSYLHLNDYRGSEYTYNLLAKMLNKEVCVIQSYNPDHYAIVNAATNNYENYYEKEITIREMLGYEPFKEMNKIIITGPYKKLFHFAYYYRKAIKYVIGEENILGPSYDYKARGVKLILKHNEFEKVIDVLNSAIKNFGEPKLNVSFQRYSKVM